MTAVVHFEEIAQELAEQFAKTAVARDKKGGNAKYERDLIRERHVTKDKLPNQCVVIIGGIRHMLTFDGVKLIADVIVSA